MVEELKPCPFCGAKAQIVDDDGYRYLVVCTNWRNCLAKSPGTRYYNFKEQAVAAWNTRHESGELPEWFVNRVNSIIKNIYADLDKNPVGNYLSGRGDDAIRQIEFVEYILSLRKEDK